MDNNHPAVHTTHQLYLAVYPWLTKWLESHPTPAECKIMQPTIAAMKEAEQLLLKSKYKIPVLTS